MPNVNLRPLKAALAGYAYMPNANLRQRKADTGSDRLPLEAK